MGCGPDSILAGDFTGDGKLDLVVADADGVQMLLGNGDGTFQPAETVATVVGGPLVAGDFNGDGDLDLAVVSADDSGDGIVSILLGNGDGTFQPAVNYSVGTSLVAIAAGDFGGDGVLDLAVTGSFGVDYSVLMGNGNGTFQPAVNYGLPGYTGAIAAGDFSGDGKSDLAIVRTPVTDAIMDDPLFNTVSILMSNGDGTFSAPGQSGITPMGNPLVADVNGDGTDDVLVIDGAGDILYRQGVPGQPGTFEPPVTVNPPPPDGINPYTSRDIAWVPDTLDGPLLASADAQDANVSLYAYRNGTFVRVGSLTTGQLPAQVIAVDLNGTGWDDLVVRNAAAGTLSIYFNAGDKAVSGPAFIGPKNTGNGPFGYPVTLPAGIGVSDVQAVDTTGDGRLDLVVTNKLTGQVSVLLNMGGGRFAAAVPYRAGSGLSAVDPGSTPEVTSLEETAGRPQAHSRPAAPPTW